MAGNVYGNIEIAVSNAARFTNAQAGDTLIYPDSNAQRICMGVQQGSNAAIIITSNNITFSNPLFVSGIEAPGYRLSLNNSFMYNTSVISSLNANPIYNLNLTFSNTSNNTTSNSAIFTLSNTHTDIRFLSASSCNIMAITSNGQLQINSNATSNVPTFSWQGDSNTGMYLSSNNQISFTSAGSNVMTIAPTLDTNISGNISAQNVNCLRNKIINGDMRIDQRNNNGASSLSNTSNVMQAYFVDRFAIDLAANSGIIQARQVALTSNDTPFQKGFRNAAQITVSNAIATLSNLSTRQTIEGFNMADLGWGTSNGTPITLSYWFKSTGGAGTYCSSIVLPTTGASTYSYYTVPFQYSNNNVWQYVSTTIPALPSNITVTTACNACTEVHIAPLTAVTNNSRNAWVSGTPPVISLTPQLSLPTYTSAGGTHPTFCNDRVIFNPGLSISSTANQAQFLNFGSQTFSFGTTGFSVTCTFRFTAYSSGGYERVIDFGSGSPNNNIILTRNGTTSNVLFCYFNGTNTTRYDAISTTNFELNTIYNVTAVYNASASATGIMYLYVNGVLEAQTTPAAKGTDRTVTCYVGRSTPPWTDPALNADIYAMNVYNRPISTTEIAQANTSTPSNAFNWVTSAYTVPFMSVSSRAVFPTWNSTGGANPTFNTDRVTFAPGAAVQSSSASCQFINFGARTFNIGTIGFSATFTFKFTGTAGSSERIFDFGSGAGTDNIICYRTGANTTLTFLVNSGASTSGYVTSAGTFSQNTIYNVALVFNPTAGTNGTFYFYINGTLDASSAASSKPTDRTVTASYVGKSWWNTDAALNGDIYNLSIHNRVITAAEIAAANIPSTSVVTWESTAVAGNAISITGVQLEKGSLASPFEFRPYAYEQALCYRYHYKRFNETSNDRYWFWATESAGTSGFTYYATPVTMRSNCVGNLSALADFQYGTSTTSYTTSVATSASSRSGVIGFGGNSTTAFTTFQINTYNKNIGTAFMSFDAEF